MLKTLINSLVKNNQYKIKQLQQIVDDINRLEKKYEKFSDLQLLEQTNKWKKELREEEFSKEEIAEKLNALLSDAFAVVRESAKRAMQQRHRDVQLIAGIVLHHGKIAEQKTGEGKTLTATLPLYLNALAGKGAHLVTPNDYLSKHGAGWYGPVYHLLGLKVGVIVDNESFIYDPGYYSETTLDEYSRHLKPVDKKEAYQADIAYGTHSQFGFDYLYDNMRMQKEQLIQTNPLGEFGIQNFAIVDEIDSVLIDVARTPLIISQPQEIEAHKYHEFAALAKGLVKDTDYEVNEKEKYVNLTEIGISKIERKLGVENLYEKDFETVHRIENALKAETLFQKDKDYVIQDGQVIIIDQNTGRLLPGVRWGSGQHQAVEAKENASIQAESKTFATISYQNYFRLYSKLAGMTGTAETEAEEFNKMYDLDVVVIPTFRPIAREDKSDIVYKSQTAKFKAVVEDIRKRYKKGQPVLIGTTSVEKSQFLANYLKRLKIPHQILNAKNHEKEAQIIAQAGKKGAVTVATNMAGRGVDIILGGDPFDENAYNEVVALGGLYVIGTERHDSRRIDNQLRGRSGRQGDPGESRFYLSLQDDLLRLFGGDRIESVMERFKVDENIPIEAGLISRSIENAQKKVEGINFDQRRGVVRYDDVMNVQRETVYGIRKQILFSENNRKEFLGWFREQIGQHANDEFWKTWDSKEKKFGEKLWFEVIRQVSLEVVTVLWTDHIDTMDDLRSGVGLRQYGQVDPLVEYRREGRILFEKLINDIWRTVVDRLSLVEVRVARGVEKKAEDVKEEDFNVQSGEIESGFKDEAGLAAGAAVPATSKEKPGRNDPCWCGSGKKYKKCHWPE